MRKRTERKDKSRLKKRIKKKVYYRRERTTFKRFIRQKVQNSS